MLGMHKDIKKLTNDFKDREEGVMSANHATKFEAKLMKELHPTKSKKVVVIQWLSVAAILAIIFVVYTKLDTTGTADKPIEITSPTTTTEVSLSDISPEFKTVETYFTNTINLELSSLDVKEEHQQLLEDYLQEIGSLTKQYKSLNQELIKNGLNDDIIDALINNLQLRLQLVLRLKKQVKKIKEQNTQEYENQII